MPHACLSCRGTLDIGRGAQRINNRLGKGYGPVPNGDVVAAVAVEGEVI